MMPNNVVYLDNLLYFETQPICLFKVMLSFACACLKRALTPAYLFTSSSNLQITVTSHQQT